MEKQVLPVWTIIPELITALKNHRNIVLTAPPGSGKTTQVPQAILDSDLVKGTIIVVQPRRVACRAVSMRIAEERNIAIGDEVGYIVRYDGKTSSETKILFVTDGVLMRFLERDPSLSWAGVVIFDEFHERHAITDVALGLLKHEQKRRSSLRLIVMSATIEETQIARYLDAVSLVANGKTYPVDVRYSPVSNHEQALDEAVKAVVSVHATKRSGDILVFLAGKEEIRRVEKAINSLKLIDLVVMPLHGELPRAAQDRVFKKVSGRKVILATNIAETSVTIPGVSTVIDSGYEKRADFDPAYGINRLALTRISQASADQRKGRAGRESPGFCIRLWDKRIQSKLTQRTPVEMQRTDLSTIVLSLKSLGITDSLTFDFLDAPDVELLSVAEEFLVQIGAVGKDRRLSPTGWRIARLPLPPRYARMVVESERSGCLKEIASIAALMAGRPILSTKTNKGEIGAKVRFAEDDASDFFSLLKMFRISRAKRWSAEWCEKYGVNADALHEAVRLRRKIIRVAFKRGSPKTYRSGSNEAIRRCILTGLVDRIALHEVDRNYRLSNGLLCKKDTSTIVKGRLLAVADTRFIRGKFQDTDEPVGSIGFVTRIDARMLQQVAPHLLREVRIPMELNTIRGIMKVRVVKRYLDLDLSSEETELEIPDAIRVIFEQRRRAKRCAWHRVNVLPSIGRNAHVEWQGERVPVSAQESGPHWASVMGSHNPVILIRERIVDIPGLDQPVEAPVPQALNRRITRSSKALSKLLGNNS